MSAAPTPTTDTSARKTSAPIADAPGTTASEPSTLAPGDDPVRADAPGVGADGLLNNPEAPAAAVAEPALTGAEAEAALEQLDASLAHAAEALAEEEPTTGAPSEVRETDAADVSPSVVESQSSVPPDGPPAPGEVAGVTPIANATGPAAATETGAAEFETAADVVAEVAASDVAVPAELVQSATAAAGAGAAQAAPAAPPTASADPIKKASDRVPDRAATKDGDLKHATASTSRSGTAAKLKSKVAALAPRAGVAALGVIALPLRLMGDSARTTVGMFAGATLATAGIVWGMVLFAPPPKATSPVEKLLAIAEKEREAAHAEGAGGHGAAAGGHAEAKPKADAHGAKPAKKDAGHGGGGGHEAKPKKKEASHAPAKKADKGAKKKDAAHGGDGGGGGGGGH